jgi:hypothetical protein
MKKLATPSRLLLATACKSKVSKINDVSLGDNSDNFENEDEEEETTSSPQEADVHTVVEDGVATRVSGHDITPPPLLTKIIDPFQEGNGKGDARAQVPTKIDLPKLTNAQREYNFSPYEQSYNYHKWKEKFFP